MTFLWDSKNPGLINSARDKLRSNPQILFEKIIHEYIPNLKINEERRQRLNLFKINQNIDKMYPEDVVISEDEYNIQIDDWLNDCLDIY